MTVNEWEVTTMRDIRAVIVMRLVIIAAVVSVVGSWASWDVAAKQPRFVDNGDGTVTDNLTGLQWEKKLQPPPFNVHGVDTGPQRSSACAVSCASRAGAAVE